MLAAVLVAWDLCSLLNGLVIQINQPAPFSVWVLTPAVLILFLLEIRHVRRAAPATAAAMVSIALVHPTYAIPALVLAAGLLAGAWLARRPPDPHPGAHPGRVDAPDRRSSRSGSGRSRSAAATATRCCRTPTSSCCTAARRCVMYPWAPVFQRGYVLAAILLLPVVARYRRLLPLAASSVALLLLLLVPGVNTAVITAVGMGQFHRFWQPLTWPAVAAAGACIVAAALGRWVWPRRDRPRRRPARGARRRTGSGTRRRACSSCAALVAVPLAALRWPARRPPALAFSPGAVALVAAVLAPWIWHWGPVVRTSAEAGPYRSPPGVRDGADHAPAPWRPSAASTARRRSCWAIPQRLFELFAFADVRAAVLPEARTRAVPRLDESGLNHLGPGVLLARDDHRPPQRDPAPDARLLRAARPARPAARRGAAHRRRPGAAARSTATRPTCPITSAGSRSCA